MRFGKLSDYQLKLHIDPEVKPVAQKPRRIPYPLKEKVTKKINELLDLEIIEKVSGPTTWVSPAEFVPKPNKDGVRICVDMKCANEAIRREKLPTPTVDEVLKELNGSTVFSKLDMNMGFHEIELEEGCGDIRTFSAGDSLFHYKRLSFGNTRTLLDKRLLGALELPTSLTTLWCMERQPRTTTETLSHC